MKKNLSALALLAAALVGVQAQTPETRPAPPTAPSGGLPASPTTPGLPASSATRGFPASPAIPGTFGFTNTLGTGSNIFATNFLANLQPLLVELQEDLEQVLPSVAAINNTFALGNFGANVPGVPSQTVGANLSGNTSVDLSSGAGANLGANFSTPVGGTATGTATGGTTPGGSTGAGTTTTTPSQTAEAGTMPPSATGAATGFSSGFGSAGTNFFMTPGAANTLQALIVLQNDIQRMLPVIVSLNGGSLDLPALLNTGRGTNAVGLTTNRVGATPTGRTFVPAPGSPAATGQTRP